MDQNVYLIKFDNGSAVLLKAWFSDNPAATENCDACIGYSVHDPVTYDCKDGGEMDYAQAEKNYADIGQALDDVIGFAFDGAAPASVTASGVDPEDLED